mgnify:CR=1 FL=1
MSILKQFGRLSVDKVKAQAEIESLPYRLNLDERMALRREMLFQVVRDVMGEWGLPGSSYRFRVVPVDPRGHTYVVMIDLPIQFITEVSISQSDLKRLGALVDLASRKRFKLRVTGVYWRVSESLGVDFLDQSGTRQALPAGCNVLSNHVSIEEARIAAVEQSLAQSESFCVSGRLYDTDHSPLTPRPVDAGSP